jgi:hypothetical protein
MKTKYQIWLIVFGILVAAMCIVQSVNKPGFHGKETYLSILHDSEGKAFFSNRAFE